MRNILILLSFMFILLSCSKEEKEDLPKDPIILPPYNPTYVDLNDRLPSYLPRMDIPADNKTTIEGIELGRALFYEPLLSGDGTQSCGSCHNQSYGFTDNGKKFSTGIDQVEGNRNSMQIINAGLRTSFFWDGRAATLEDQAFGPVTNPIEMHEKWPRAVAKINDISTYREMGYKAFGVVQLDSVLISKAIAQFERSIISGNSKYDRWKKGEYQMTPQEDYGRKLFNKDRDEIRDSLGNVIQVIPGADCFHCHGDLSDFTDNLFHNNGMDEIFTDPGREKVTGNAYDRGKFKVPTLRNIEYTAPYMHDGRFKTLDEVIDHYSDGLVHSATIDPLMKNVDIGGVRLSLSEKAALKAFLLTLSDPDFLDNPDYSEPPPL